MTYGSGMRDDSQQLRDIQDLIARLADVNRKLALPARAMPTDQAADAEAADAPTVGVNQLKDWKFVRSKTVFALRTKGGFTEASTHLSTMSRW